MYMAVKVNCNYITCVIILFMVLFITVLNLTRTNRWFLTIKGIISQTWKEEAWREITQKQTGNWHSCEGALDGWSTITRSLKPFILMRTAGHIAYIPISPCGKSRSKQAGGFKNYAPRTNTDKLGTTHHQEQARVAWNWQKPYIKFLNARKVEALQMPRLLVQLDVMHTNQPTAVSLANCNSHLFTPPSSKKFAYTMIHTKGDVRYHSETRSDLKTTKTAKQEIIYEALYIGAPGCGSIQRPPHRAYHRNEFYLHNLHLTWRATYCMFPTTGLLKFSCCLKWRRKEIRQKMSAPVHIFRGRV